MKIVLNKCFGGFGVSRECAEFMAARGHKAAQDAVAEKGHWYGGFCRDDEHRSDPLLVEAVETLGSKRASGEYAALQVVDVPDSIEWYIDGYDGVETVDEQEWRG